MSKKPINIQPYFFSFNSDNANEFKRILDKSFYDFINWRNSFHPEDLKLVHQTDRTEKTYAESHQRFEMYFNELLQRLHGATPFHSPRYIGHMQSERLMPAVLGYFASMLYSLNNISYEGSTVTTEMEYEVAADLAKMIGYDTKNSWGHLTSGGTIANIEALWVARNVKYFPLIAKDLAYKHSKDFIVKLLNGTKSDIKVLDDYVLLTLPPLTVQKLVSDVFNADWGVNIADEVYASDKNISCKGMDDFYNGKIFVAATKHYSWLKAAEILGFGRKNTVIVDVDENFRMDTEDLKDKLVQCVKNKEPIVAVVGMLGTTEASAVDPLDKIVAIRKWYEKEYNSSFFIHVDAAYGGYVKSLFLDCDDKIRKYDDVKKTLNGTWPCKEVYNAYAALEEADSVTVDPHKLGYVPYSAGAVVYKTKVTKNATIVKAPYISNTTKPATEDLYFGEYILEGSKPGAAAAACWLAHRVVPLNECGYGQVLKNPIYDATFVMKKFKKAFPAKINGKTVNIEFFNVPDIDIMLFAFNIEGNKSLQECDGFNKKIIEKMSFNPHKPLYEHNYMVASTVFTYDIYKNSINKALTNLNINPAEWATGDQPLTLFRCAIVNPNLYTTELKEYFYQGFVDEFKKVIAKIV